MNFIISLLFLSHVGHTAALADRLSEWGVVLKGLPDFSISAQAADKSNSEVSAQSGEHRIRIARLTEITADAAEKYMADHRARIEALYQQRSDGYFPKQAHGRVCEAQMIPKFKTAKNKEARVEVLALYAGSRYVLGACTSGLGKFRALAAVAYCPAKRELYEITYFSPVKNFKPAEESALLAFDCSNATPPH